jgi:hypothetical protein
MLRSPGQGRALLALFAALAIAAAACGGSQASGSTNPAAVSSSPASGASGGTSGLGGAAAALANIGSYKFKMTLAGGDWGSTLSAFGASASANAPIDITGTIVVKPAKAIDITVGVMHVIEVGGNSYLDLTGSGTFISSPTATSLDSFAPATMFSSLIDPSLLGDFNKVGTGPRNGVNADHYQGSPAVISALGTLTNVQSATWTADLWIATDGGYPVGMAIVGTAADGTVAYEMVFDITNVNDPSNAVTAPSA